MKEELKKEKEGANKVGLKLKEAQKGAEDADNDAPDAKKRGSDHKGTSRRNNENVGGNKGGIKMASYHTEAMMWKKSWTRRRSRSRS